MLISHSWYILNYILNYTVYLPNGLFYNRRRMYWTHNTTWCRLPLWHPQSRRCAVLLRLAFCSRDKVKRSTSDGISEEQWLLTYKPAYLFINANVTAHLSKIKKIKNHYICRETKKDKNVSLKLKNNKNIQNKMNKILMFVNSDRFTIPSTFQVKR